MKKNISIGLASFVFGVGAAHASIPINRPAADVVVELQSASKTTFETQKQATTTTPAPALKVAGGFCRVYFGRVACN